MYFNCSRSGWQRQQQSVLVVVLLDPRSAVCFYVVAFIVYCITTIPQLFNKAAAGHQPIGVPLCTLLGSDGNIAIQAFTIFTRRQLIFHLPLMQRSEERRVGKECRSRWS